MHVLCGVLAIKICYLWKCLVAASERKMPGAISEPAFIQIQIFISYILWFIRGVSPSHTLRQELEQRFASSTPPSRSHLKFMAKNTLQMISSRTTNNNAHMWFMRGMHLHLSEFDEMCVLLGVRFICQKNRKSWLLWHLVSIKWQWSDNEFDFWQQIDIVPCSKQWFPFAFNPFFRVTWHSMRVEGGCKWQKWNWMP